MIPARRSEIEEQRAKDKTEYAESMKHWEQLYPPDSTASIARTLHEFLDATPDVDFAAEQRRVEGEGGSSMVFVTQAYRDKPWQWRFSYERGPGAIAAARTAAQAWLKELGR